MGSLVMIFSFFFWTLQGVLHTYTQTNTNKYIRDARGLLQSWDVIITQDRVTAESKC